MATIGKQDATSTTDLENRTVDTMTGDGSDTTLVLSSTPLSINNVLVFISGVLQRPTTDYTLSGTTITFSEAPLTGLKVVAITGGGEHIGIPLTRLDASKFSNSAVTDAKIATGISASKLTGALPALDGSALTGVSSANVSGVDTVSANDPTSTTNPASVGHIWLNRVSGEMFVCTDNTVGANIWTNIGEGSGNIPYMTATSTNGIETTDGDYKVVTFNTSGSFTPNIGVAGIGDFVEYLVVAGGGGGGNDYYGGGGGAGGYLTATSFSVTSSAMTVTVGGGGQVNVNGQNSVFGSITSTGGGAGGTGSYSGLNALANGKNGGSGGGGNANSNTGGTGIAGQGFAGGTASAGGAAGSGGGAGGVAPNNVGQNVSNIGGVGLSSQITGTAVVRGEGGTGGALTTAATPVAGAGKGCTNAITNATAGAANRGGGGGGSGFGVNTAGLGGSGVVIIRYRFR